ncbi:MAG: hypothetical protein PHP44_15570 [Kiritimatiellae bacterium]|nr:hypothetical protein [Kiritimatiellia bacterium]
MNSIIRISTMSLTLSLVIALPGLVHAQRDPAVESTFHREFETPTQQAIQNMNPDGNIERIADEVHVSETMHQDETNTAEREEKKESQTAETIHEQETAHAQGLHQLENETKVPDGLDRQSPATETIGPE